MNALRAIPAGMLAAAAAVLGGASKLAELGARRLAPRSDAAQPRHSSFPNDDDRDDTEPAARPYASSGLYDAETDTDSSAQARPDVEEVTTEDLVTAADFAAEMDATRESLVADAELGAVAGDTVVADDAIEAMVAGAMADATVADVGSQTAGVTPPARPVDEDTAPDVPSLEEAVLGADGEARTYESHIAELADRNVASVVREIQDLSTEELGQLFEYESAHRKRKTVLQAIERATAPDDGPART